MKIDGEVWTARSFDEDQVFDPGERVEVVEIQGRDCARDALRHLLRRLDSPQPRQVENRILMVALIVIAV